MKDLDTDFIETIEKTLKTDEQVTGCNGNFDIEYTFMYPVNLILLSEDELINTVQSVRNMLDKYYTDALNILKNY